ncbi:IclR family transcriptional regulator [Microbacterium fluvii]|uniref:IclR family transcriptional regulator n=1 Tax=Microbacterium fluvii TaxID=415215 RepID=A0ABW2H8X4_9MICO|nr:IclR family transcriptional regulator [Microbacterium fluvii]MCU4671184.1 IclR family transcriptional regulator [Microbacterium fluvii]
MERNEAPRIESVHRALVLVKLLSDTESISVTEAAAALSVNASTAQRLLATLVLDGFAVQQTDRRYAVGPAMTSVGPPRQASNLVRSAMEELLARTGETVHLAYLAGTRIQHTDGIEATAHALRFTLRVGVWLPAHLTAGGKALLADLTDDEVDARYSMALAGPRASRLNVDMAQLHDQLDEVRETRVAWNLEESEPGLAAVAISISQEGGQHAALSVALPIARFSKERGEQWSADLIDIADRLRALSAK